MMSILLVILQADETDIMLSILILYAMCILITKRDLLYNYFVFFTASQNAVRVITRVFGVLNILYLVTRIKY